MTQVLDNRFSFFFTSKTAIPTADANGLPPKVLKIEAWVRVSAISLVVATAANGNPLPMPKSFGFLKNCSHTIQNVL